MVNFSKFLIFLLVVRFAYAAPTHGQSSSHMIHPCPTTLGKVALVRPDSIDELAPAIAEHLSGGVGIVALESQLTNIGINVGSVWAADVTGDGFEDVVVNIRESSTLDGYPSTLSITWLFRCEGSQYVISGEIDNNYLGDIALGRGQRVGAVGDLTGDYAAEIVTHITDCGAHTCYLDLDIYEFRPEANGLVSLCGQDTSLPSCMSFLAGSYDVEDGMLLGHKGVIGSTGAGPQRTHELTYVWNGSEFELISDIVAPPFYRVHALIDTTDALVEGDYDTAAALFERALNDPDLEIVGWHGNGGLIEQSYATYGLLVTLSARDGIEADSTRAALDLLAELPDLPSLPSYTYPSTTYPAENLWRRYGELFYTTASSNGLSMACEMVLADIEATSNVSDNGDVRLPYNYWGNYGYGNGPPSPEEVCPF